MTRAEELRDAFVQTADATGFGALGIHVRVGDDVAAYDWQPPQRRDIQSAAKALCVLAAGVAADEGLVDLDAPLADLVPGTDLADVRLGEGVEAVTLRHLLSMSSGIDHPWSPTLMTDFPDLAREFLSRPSRGRVFQYSNASTYAAMRVLASRTGDIAKWVDARVFAPLGIADVEWERCPLGHVVAGGGVFLTTEELARIGLLVRERGRWGHTAVVSPGIIDAMHDPWMPTGSGPGYDRYALSGWAGPGDAWRIHGAMGQLILFAGDAVVTITADDHFGADAYAASVVSLIG